MTWFDDVVLGASSCVLMFFALAMFPAFLDRLRSIGRRIPAAIDHIALRVGSRHA